MSLTLAEWIMVGVIGVGAIIFAAYITSDMYNKKLRWIPFVVIILVICGIIFGINWYNTSTASGARSYKDWQSNINNGIEREITITAEDGREIFHYEGKIDVESDHDDNYIKFESEDGKRYIIYYGVQDTITIIEK